MMGLFGGLFGSSKASSTSSAQTDNRRVMGDGAVSMELAGNSSLTQNTSSFTSNFVTATDLGAIQAAQRIAQESALAGSEVARASLAGAFGFGSDAVGLSADALAMGGKAVTDALDFGGNAMDYASGAFGSALASNGRATADALGFGSGAMDQAFGLVDSVVSNAVDVIASRAGAESSALRSIYETALGQINTSNARLGDAYADSQGRGALTDKMLMVAIGGAVLIAVMAVRGK